VGTTFFRFVTIHAFARQTDGQTAFSWLDSVACNAVKTNKIGTSRIMSGLVLITIHWVCDALVFYCCVEFTWLFHYTNRPNSCMLLQHTKL